MKTNLEDKTPEDYLREEEEAEGEESYFKDEEDKCPPLGMQGGVVTTKRRIG